jgi:outer membrane immunogenic protein
MRFKLSGAAAAVLLASMAPAGAQMTPGGMFAPPAVDWGGFYTGLNVGGGSATSHFKYTPPAPFPAGGSGVMSNGGPVGGGQAGFNWQFGNGWVLGVEGDIDASGISGSKSCGPALAYNCGSSDSWLGTIRGRVGYATGNVLWFATGGGAWGDITRNVNNAPFPRINHDDTESGWTAGGGAEFMVAPAWSLKVEYRHVDLGNRFVGDLGLAGVNFHFNAPPPPPPAPAAIPAPPPAAPKVFIVFFDWDKDVVTREGQMIIQQAADAYKAGAPVQIQVTGYTDRSGSPGYNQRLSERRANNVAKALAALGVPKTQMAVSGRGENDNRVPTAPGVREPQNRRVEIVSP